MADLSIPKQAIEFIVNRMHVGVSDEAVAADIRRRVRKNFKAPASLEKRCVEYALRVHHTNQSMYAEVINGRIS